MWQIASIVFVPSHLPTSVFVLEAPFVAEIVQKQVNKYCTKACTVLRTLQQET